MKIALITDQHFGVRNDSKYFLDQYEQFYNQVFFPKLIEEGIDTLFMLGDFWEHRKTLNILTLHHARKMYFDRLAELGIQVKIIYGNHDVYYKNSNEVNSIDMIGAMYSNVEVVKQHKVFEFDGVPIAFISWINNSNLEESLKFIATAPAAILCGHFEIKTFEMMRGTPCESGFEAGIFDRYEQVWSGHFHVISSKDNITYLSNPSQTNWGDYGLKKGFWIFDTTTRLKEHVENPFEVYAKIAYNDEVSVVDFDFEQYKNKIVRVYIESFAQTNQHKLNLFLEKLGSFVHQSEVFEIDNSLTGELNESDLDFTNTNAVIKQYIEDVVQNDKVDKVTLESIFMSLYNEAMETVEGE